MRRSFATNLYGRIPTEYDELGQLKRKKVGGTLNNELQVVDYTYNIRGWLKQINDVNNLGSTDLFAFKFNYNDIADVNKRLYNRNISQTFWKTANIDSSLKDYEFTYDHLNRITSGIGANTSNYNLTNVAYDKNGNITNLERKGHTAIDGNEFIQSSLVKRKIGFIRGLDAGIKTISNVKQISDNVNNGTMESTNTSSEVDIDKDTTYTVPYADGIEVWLETETFLTLHGKQKAIEVTTKGSKVDSVKNDSKKSLEKQELEMELMQNNNR